MGGVYRVPIVHAQVKGYFTNTTTVTSYRGAGRPEAIYVTERLMDAAAKPLESTARRSAGAPDRKTRAALSELKGLPIDSGDFLINLEEAQRRADWDGFAARRRLSEERGKRRGRGISYYFGSIGRTARESTPPKSASPRTGPSRFISPRNRTGRDTRPYLLSSCRTGSACRLRIGDRQAGRYR